ncbi:phage tail assembly chaperone [Methylobacterium sp. SI9]|uniref:phage tail assembly chaperone n=1 Tax=Methylobacterium guangdongense TaxID=3138811 RepID=UPI00313D1805
MAPRAPSRFTIGPDTFRHAPLNAADEFHCVRRVAPVVKNAGLLATALAAKDGEGEPGERIAGVIEGGAPLFQAFADMTEEDASYVMERCMSATEMLDGEIWVPTWDPEIKAPAIPSLRMIHVLRICYSVLKDAIAVFFSDAVSSLKELGLLRRTMIP